MKSIIEAVKIEAIKQSKPKIKNIEPKLSKENTKNSIWFNLSVR
jgi:hypothetical protein